MVDIKRESHSAKNSGERPVYNELLLEMREGKYQGIITWATDRLSRNAGDLGMLVDMMDRRLLAEIRTFNQVFTNSPNDKFLLMILGSQAKLENDNRAINVVRGMKAKCEMGVRLCMTPLGYLNDPVHAKGMKVITLDPVRAPIIKKFYEMSANGVAGRKILKWADTQGFTTRKGKPLSPTALYDLLSNPYYYGEFEWPVGSGTWYKVNHESIVTKELFNRVQKRFKSMPKGRAGTKSFDYSGTMVCGECGSSITAVEKIKHLKDGSHNKHIYYMCSRYTRYVCKQRPIKESDLVEQLVDLMNGVNLDKFLLKTEYEYEVKKLHTMSQQLGDNYQKKAKQRLDIRSNMKYVVQNGSAEEKKRLLKNLGQKIKLEEKAIYLD